MQPRAPLRRPLPVRIQLEVRGPWLLVLSPIGVMTDPGWVQDRDVRYPTLNIVNKPKNRQENVLKSVQNCTGSFQYEFFEKYSI